MPHVPRSPGLPARRLTWSGFWVRSGVSGAFESKKRAQPRPEAATAPKSGVLDRSGDTDGGLTMREPLAR